MLSQELSVVTFEADLMCHSDNCGTCGDVQAIVAFFTQNLTIRTAPTTRRLLPTLTVLDTAALC